MRIQLKHIPQTSPTNQNAVLNPALLGEEVHEVFKRRLLRNDFHDDSTKSIVYGVIEDRGELVGDPMAEFESDCRSPVD